MRPSGLAWTLTAWLALCCALGTPAWAARAVVDWPERSVNVRAGPDLSAKRIGSLPRGTELEVLGSRGEWVRVRHEAGEGWVVERSLRRIPEPVPEAPAAELALSPAHEAGAEPGPTPEPESRPETGEPVPGSAPPPAESSVVVPTPAETVPSVVLPGGSAPEAPLDRGGYLTGLEEAPLTPYDPGSGLLNMLSGLLLVLALLAGLVWVVRRLSGGRLLAGGRRAGPIRVLASRAVGPRQGLVLVEVGGLVWLLSQGPEGLRLVAEIRDEGALARLDQQYGFLESPFEAVLRTGLDLESGAAAADGSRGPEPTPAERLAALRRRPPPGGPS